MKAVIDDKIPYIRGEIEKLASEVVYLLGAEITADNVRDADVLIIRTRTHCNESLLHDSRVRLILTATIGYDHIDTAYCAAHSIEWHNCPDCNANSVATYIKNTIHTLQHPSLQLPLNSPSTPLELPLTIALFGLGHVGSIVARNAENDGFRVLRYDPFLGYDDYDEILRSADIITFHVPLTYDGPHPTHYMADEHFFSSLRCRPFIINTSRGGVVKESALLSALDNGLIRGAVIDTWENEPCINLDLLHKALIATPHIAGYSANGKYNATRMVLQHLRTYLTHTPPSPENQSSPEFPSLPLLTPQTLLSDSQLLKAHPDQFESFRNHYPPRCENVQ